MCSKKKGVLKMKSLLKILSGVMFGFILVILLMVIVVEPEMIEKTLRKPMKEVLFQYNERNLSVAAEKTQEVINVLVANQSIKVWLDLPETEFLDYYLSNLYELKDIFLGKEGDVEFRFNLAIDGYIGNLGINDTWYLYGLLPIVILWAIFFLFGFSYVLVKPKEEE